MTYSLHPDEDEKVRRSFMDCNVDKVPGAFSYPAVEAMLHPIVEVEEQK